MPSQRPLQTFEILKMPLRTVQSIILKSKRALVQRALVQCCCTSSLKKCVISHALSVCRLISCRQKFCKITANIIEDFYVPYYISNAGQIFWLILKKAFRLVVAKFTIRNLRYTIIYTLASTCVFSVTLRINSFMKIERPELTIGLSVTWTYPRAPNSHGALASALMREFRYRSFQSTRVNHL